MKTSSLGCALLFLSGTAGADAPRGSSYATDAAAKNVPTQTIVGEKANEADLQVKQLPPRMRMRTDRPKAKGKKRVAAVGVKGSVDAGASGAGADAAASGGDVSYKMFPTSMRDLRERVTFRIRAGVEVDTAPASGETLRGGYPLPDGFTDTRPWIMGDAVVGARGIITPTLNGYFLSSFAFDASDSLATRTATIMPYDNENIAIKAGYAEYGRDDRKPDNQQPNKFWLRAGRQFRLDGGNLFAYFDGATVAYREQTWSASAFAGQRVALYVNTEPGIVFGATGALKMKKLRVNLDYMGLAITSSDLDNDPTTGNANGLDGETRHLVGVSAHSNLSRKAQLDVRARLTGLPDVANTNAGELPATKFALGRVGARLRYEGNKLIVIGDVDQRFKDDVAYDLAAPSSVDIVDVANKLGVGMNQPIDATTLGVQVDWQTPNRKTEIFGIGRASFATGDAPTTVDNRNYVEGGVGIAGTPVGIRNLGGVYTTAQYTYRQFTDEGVSDGMRIDGVCNDLTDVDGDGIPDNCQEFGNSASSGVDRMHQLAGEAVLATRGSGGRHWRLGAGAFFRVYDFRTPYREVTNDARGGGRLDLRYWFNRDLHLNVAGEVAQASPTLSRDLGTLTSLRAALEARW